MDTRQEIQQRVDELCAHILANCRAVTLTSHEADDVLRVEIDGGGGQHTLPYGMSAAQWKDVKRQSERARATATRCPESLAEAVASIRAHWAELGESACLQIESGLLSATTDASPFWQSISTGGMTIIIAPADVLRPLPTPPAGCRMAA